MRVVLDTNVLISGIGWKSGPPGRIVEAWNGQFFEVIITGDIFEEYKRVLTEFADRRDGIDIEPVLALIASKAFGFPLFP